ncbi:MULTISPECIES: hypothetical protein [Listeria]|uniref:hypothetical protein n=1 Tax=Listeria TaxID=1637 RepID=UPI000B58A4DD|nr:MULTISPECIES: hypothetical protein [Listeria]
MQTFILILILAALTFIGYWAKGLPEIYKAITVEDNRKENELDIQRESFFRELRGEELANIFGDWVSAFTDMEKFTQKMTGKEGVRYLSDMQKKALMYGSPKTVAILAMMFQHTYVSDKVENKIKVNFGKTQEESAENYKLMVYIANLIASLKFDFTGYKIDPIDIIRVKINDFTEKEELFIQIQEEIVKALKKTGYEI